MDISWTISSMYTWSHTDPISPVPNLAAKQVNVVECCMALPEQLTEEFHTITLVLYSNCEHGLVP